MKQITSAVLTLLCLISITTHADCAKDISGEVYCGGGTCLSDRAGTIWCSKHYRGGAMKTRDGRVLCGMGDCKKDSSGNIFCSSETGGAVIKDSRGDVRCYGLCEPAIEGNCENTLADTAK